MLKSPNIRRKSRLSSNPQINKSLPGEGRLFLLKNKEVVRLHFLFNIGNSFPYGGDFLRVFIRDLTAKLVFKLHN